MNWLHISVLTVLASKIFTYARAIATRHEFTDSRVKEVVIADLSKFITSIVTGVLNAPVGDTPYQQRA